MIQLRPNGQLQERVGEVAFVCGAKSTMLRTIGFGIALSSK